MADAGHICQFRTGAVTGLELIPNFNALNFVDMVTHIVGQFLEQPVLEQPLLRNLYVLYNGERQNLLPAKAAPPSL